MDQHATCPLCERFLCPCTVRSHPGCTGVICQGCVERAGTSSCPFCRCPGPAFQPLDPLGSPAAKELLAVFRRCSAHPRCRQRRAGACDIVRHEAECPHLTVVCPVEGCEVRVAREDVEAHVRVCEFRARWCVMCGGERHPREGGRGCLWGELDEAWRQGDAEATSRLLRRVFVRFFGRPPWNARSFPGDGQLRPADAPGIGDCEEECRRLWRAVRGWDELGSCVWGFVSLLMRGLQSKDSSRYTRALTTYLSLNVDNDMGLCALRIPLVPKPELLELFASIEHLWDSSMAIRACHAHFLWNVDRQGALRTLLSVCERLSEEGCTYAELVREQTVTALVATECETEPEDALAMCAGLEALVAEQAEEIPWDACRGLSAAIDLARKHGVHDMAARMASLVLERVMPLIMRRVAARPRHERAAQDHEYARALAECVHCAVALLHPSAPAGAAAEPLRRMARCFMPGRVYASKARARTAICVFARSPQRAQAMEGLVRSLDLARPECSALAWAIFGAAGLRWGPGQVAAWRIVRAAGSPAQARRLMGTMAKEAMDAFPLGVDRAAMLSHLEGAFKRECMAERFPAALQRGIFLLHLMSEVTRVLPPLSGGQRHLAGAVRLVANIFAVRDFSGWNLGSVSTGGCVFDSILFAAQHGCSLLRDLLRHGSSALPDRTAMAACRVIGEKLTLVFNTQCDRSADHMHIFFRLAIKFRYMHWKKVRPFPPSRSFIVCMCAPLIVPARAQAEKRAIQHSEEAPPLKRHMSEAC